LGVGADPFESTQNDSRRLCSCFTIHSKETCVWRRLRLGSKGNRRHKANQVTIRGCTSFLLPSGGGRGVVPVPFRWCPAGERLVPSVRHCPPCLLSAAWFGVLFPAILSCAPLRSCITRKNNKKSYKKKQKNKKNDVVILWLFNILGTRGKDSHDPDTQAHSTLSGDSCRQVWGRSSSPVPDFPPV
jgi:hypothetical protein